MFLKYLKPILNPVLISSFKPSSRNMLPRRACLYVPAHEEKKIKKAVELDVDCIILDCEDGVAATSKAQARKNIRALLDKGRPVKKRKYDLAVRINGTASGMTKEDLREIVTGKNLPNTIFLPKIDSQVELILFSDLVNSLIKGERKVGVVIMIESALALVNLFNICKKAKEISRTSKFIPVALLFGSDDYCASIGAQRTDSCSEVIYARQKIVSMAKAHNLQAIDMVHIKYQQLEGLKKQAEEGAAMGFSGKQIIHPSQVEITQKAFMPSESQIEWASAVLKAFHQHQKEGKGAFVYKDEMIDMPTMKQAQNIMDLVNAIMMTE